MEHRLDIIIVLLLSNLIVSFDYRGKFYALKLRVRKIEDYLKSKNLRFEIFLKNN